VLNAYEEGDSVVLQACRTPGTNLTPSAQGEDWSEKSWRYGSIYHNRIYEWRLNMSTGEVTEGVLGPYEAWPEFPTVNPRYVGRKNRFAYCVDYDYRVSRVLEAPASPTLVKYTLAPECTLERHDLGSNRFGEEGTFVPRGGVEAAEDDHQPCCIGEPLLAAHQVILLKVDPAAHDRGRDVRRLQQRDHRDGIELLEGT